MSGAVRKYTVIAEKLRCGNVGSKPVGAQRLVVAWASMAPNPFNLAKSVTNGTVREYFMGPIWRKNMNKHVLLLSLIHI